MVGRLKMTRDIIKSGTAAWCDQYHFTMAGAWFDCGKHLEHKTSEAFFRRMPHNCGYVLTSGLGEFLEWIDNWHISRENLDYLRSCKNRIGGQLFSNEFLDFLKGQKLSVDIKAVPEGEVVFAGEPLLSVSGPCWQVEMVEAAYLNVINAQCPIATKAARTVQASAADGKKRPVLEISTQLTELEKTNFSKFAERNYSEKVSLPNLGHYDICNICKQIISLITKMMVFCWWIPMIRVKV